MTGQTNLPLQRAILLRFTRSCNLLICTVLSKLNKDEEKGKIHLKKHVQYTGDRAIYQYTISQELFPHGHLTEIVIRKTGTMSTL